MSVTLISLQLVVIGFLVSIRLLCRKLRLPKPPIIVPLIAIAMVPWLNRLPMILTSEIPVLVHATLRTGAQLLMGYSIIRVGGWLIFKVPPRLGWWKGLPKILVDLLILCLSVTYSLIIVNRELQINLIGIAATSAVLTAVIGLAGQATLKDIFAGIALQVDAPFEEGDWIDLGFAKGGVSSLRLMSTRLNTIDGALIVIPNSLVMSESMRRFRQYQPVGQHLEVSLDYGYAVRDAIKLLETILTQHEQVLSDPAPKAWVLRYGDSGVVYRVQYWQNKLGEMAENELRSSIFEQIWYALSRSGQRPPYPGLMLQRRLCYDENSNEDIFTKQRAQSLSSNPLFEHLAPSQITRLAEQTKYQAYAPDEFVVRDGQSGDSLYLVVSGSLKVSKSTEGRNIQIKTLRENDVFGEMALFTGEPRSANVQCIEECLLLEVTRKALLPLVQEDPAILDRICPLIAARKQENKQLSTLQKNNTENHALRTKIKHLFHGLIGPRDEKN